MSRVSEHTRKSWTVHITSAELHHLLDMHGLKELSTTTRTAVTLSQVVSDGYGGFKVVFVETEKAGG